MLDSRPVCILSATKLSQAVVRGAFGSLFGPVLADLVLNLLNVIPASNNVPVQCIDLLAHLTHLGLDDPLHLALFPDLALERVSLALGIIQLGLGLARNLGHPRHHRPVVAGVRAAHHADCDLEALGAVLLRGRALGFERAGVGELGKGEVVAEFSGLAPEVRMANQGGSKVDGILALALIESSGVVWDERTCD